MKKQEKISSSEAHGCTKRAWAMIMFSLVFSIFIIGIVSAAEWDNIKSYDENTKTVTIKNSFLYVIPLGTIAEIKLNTPQVFRVGMGYQKVAEMEFTSYEDFKNYLSAPYFKLYDKKNNMKQINRQLDFKYLTTEEVSIDDFKIECINSISANGTKYQSCSKIKIGSHLETKDAWKDINKYVFKSGEPIKIGIFTDVQINDHVEWIPNLYGVKISEWAEWTEDLNVGLKAYYKFDEQDTTGTGTIINQLGQNGTNAGADNSTGKLGTAYDFQGTSDYIDLNNKSVLGGFSALTVSVWVWHDAHEDDVILASFTDPLVFLLRDDAGANLQFHLKTTSGLVGGTTQAWDTIGEWTHIVAVYNGTTMITYVNNVSSATTYAQTGTVIATGGEDYFIGKMQTNSYWNGKIDEIGIWNRSLSLAEISLLSEGTPYGLPPSNLLNVYLVSPANNTNSSSSTNYFIANVSKTGAINIVNVSLLINGTIVQTNTSGLLGIYNFSQISLEGNHNYTFIAYGNDSIRYNATNGTLFFMVDLTQPSVNLTFPESVVYNDGYIINATKTTFINFTASDTYLRSCWYSTDGGTTNITITCGTNATIGLAYGTYDIRAYANDSSGNVGTDSATPEFKFAVIQNSVTYNNQTIEGSSETFDIDFNSSGLSVSSVKLNYNGTDNNASIMSVVGNRTTARSTIIISDVTANINKSFYFSIRLSDSNIYNSSTFNQTVLNVVTDDCSSYTNILFSFTLVDEGNQTNLSVIANTTTMEINLNLLDTKRNGNILNFSKSYIKKNPAKICLNFAIPPTSSIPADVIVKYYGEGYATEYYHIFNYSLKNTTASQNITLYDLDLDDSTEFKIILTGDNFVPIENALIYIDRQYVTENNSFKTVEVPKTDTNGQTLGHFVKNEVVYNIRAVINGTVISVLNNVIAFCEDLQLGNCQISIDTRAGMGVIFEYFNQGITFSAPTFDPDTQIVSFSFLSTDGNEKTMEMIVSKNDIFGNRTVCSNSVTSASGALQCPLPGDFQETMIIVNITTNGELTAVRSINVDESSYGDIGYLIWFVLTLILILIFGESKTGILVSMAISYIGAVTLGITKGDIVGLGTAGIWILVITLAGIWKLNNQRIQ